MRIIFMGTPQFAVPSLAILVEKGEEIGAQVVAVITAPDKPSGRGQKLQASPVKKYALSQNIPVLQPTRLKNPAFLAQLKSYNADIQVVVAFRMLPKAVFAMPPLGSINLHGSLLPQYRGAAPINHAIIQGETITGLTTFFIEQQIDTGKIIFQQSLPIEQNETAGQLHDKMMYAGADLVFKTIAAIKQNDYPQIEQPTVENPKKAPKIYRQTCLINPQQPVEQLHNFIRGLSPYPGAFGYLDGLQLKIFQTHLNNPNPAEAPQNAQPGSIWHNTKTDSLYLKAENAWLEILSLQLQGKKRLSTADFLRGYTAKKWQLTQHKTNQTNN